MLPKIVFIVDKFVPNLISCNNKLRSILKNLVLIININHLLLLNLVISWKVLLSFQTYVVASIGKQKETKLICTGYWCEEGLP